MSSDPQINNNRVYNGPTDRVMCLKGICKIESVIVDNFMAPKTLNQIKLIDTMHRPTDCGISMTPVKTVFFCSVNLIIIKTALNLIARSIRLTYIFNHCFIKRVKWEKRVIREIVLNNDLFLSLRYLHEVTNCSLFFLFDFRFVTIKKI